MFLSYFRGESLSYEPSISECIDFSVENHMLSSTDMTTSIDNSVDSSLNGQTVLLKRTESAFAASALIDSSDDMQSSYIQSSNDPVGISDYQAEMDRGDDLQFLTSDGTFRMPTTSSNGSSSVINLTAYGSAGNSTSLRPQITRYTSVTTNQTYACPPMQFSSIPPPTSQYSTLGQVLTSNNERSSSYPNIVNSFLRDNNGPNPSTSVSYTSTPGTSGSPFELKPSENSMFQRVGKKSVNKQAKPRGDGSKLLSTRATYVLEGWYEANTEWPYPTKSEKQVMASAGGITIEQVRYLL